MRNDHSSLHYTQQATLQRGGGFEPAIPD